ncbi:family 1 encapsulin nanocompartment shell protein [Limisalsivibrio acetivorans]|uniref:family 1 encapsulin nanocompartment shell protein n=1 Tax=Limisalsivibrio acetivorans TaxID=1304888 RepID=UPI0003B35038|nr:family 1 encapsulin nanocompartment shell protein [Limisalsivibrio acetivorans]
MDILRQSYAPVNAVAWEEINDTAKEVLTSSLSARKIVDVVPVENMTGAVSEGRIDVVKDKSKVNYGISRVLPLVESRIPFSLKIWELDNAVRGAEDIDLDALEDAAREIAAFEENAVYNGLPKAGIKGLLSSSEHEAQKFPAKGEEIPAAVGKALGLLKEAAVEGPYSLVVSPAKWQQIVSHMSGYPLKRHIEDMIGGSIVMSRNIDDALLISQRGGDVRLNLGMDFSIGYDKHDSEKVQLYFTESFTFQILDPAAFVVFK